MTLIEVIQMEPSVLARAIMDKDRKFLLEYVIASAGIFETYTDREITTLELCADAINTYAARS